MEEMPKISFQHHAKMIEIAIDDYGTKPPELSVIENWIVDDVGIAGIRPILEGWLLVVTQPKREREAMQEKVGKLIEARGLQSFLGSNIKKCVSDT